MKYKQLTRKEGHQIYAIKKNGYLIKSIDPILVRYYSTIYREIRRNSEYPHYQSELA